MKKKLPRLKTNKEAEAFVATADLTEYDLSDMRPVRFEFQHKDRRVNKHAEMGWELLAHDLAGFTRNQTTLCRASRWHQYLCDLFTRIPARKEAFGEG